MHTGGEDGGKVDHSRHLRRLCAFRDIDRLNNSRISKSQSLVLAGALGVAYDPAPTLDFPRPARQSAPGAAIRAPRGNPREQFHRRLIISTHCCNIPQLLCLLVPPRVGLCPAPGNFKKTESSACVTSSHLLPI